jgi:capsid assembly protease
MRIDRYTRVIALAHEQPWALLPTKLAAIASLLELRAAGLTLTEQDIRARIGGDPPDAPEPQVSGGVAVLPLFGVIAQRMNLMHAMSGGTSTEQFAADFRRVRDDPAVKAIVMAIDSPGGGVYGLDELATEIRDSRGTKPIIAVASSLAASGGYYIGSAADRFVVTPSGDVGSIGVLGLHTDLTKAQEKAGVQTTLIRAGKYKGEGNPFEPLTDEARAAMQARVDDAYDGFVAAVAAGRRVPIATVRSGYGEGRLVGARDALAAGMVDEIATLDAVIERLRTRPTARAIPRAAAIASTDPPPATPQEPSRATGQELAADRLWRSSRALDLLEI